VLCAQQPSVVLDHTWAGLAPQMKAWQAPVFASM
jgi:hypothetical protein